VNATTISILAILLSPVIAVGVTLWFQRRKDRRDAKLWILNTLMQTRHHGPASDEKVRAFNMIDVVFRKSPKVRELWHEYFGMLNNVSWRAESDKKGYDWTVPMPADFFDAVRGFQREIGAIAGHVFAASDGIMDRHTFEKGLRSAEKKARLPKLDGSLWHAYRRKWATERKHLPLKDVARAGGWKDVNSLLGYQQADDASVLAVTSSTLKLRERVV